MNKRLTKPAERNERLNSPTGLIGVPPDYTPRCCRYCCRFCCGMACRRKPSFPQ